MTGKLASAESEQPYTYEETLAVGSSRPAKKPKYLHNQRDGQGTIEEYLDKSSSLMETTKAEAEFKNILMRIRDTQ